MFRFLYLTVALLTGFAWAADAQRQTVEKATTHAVKDTPVAVSSLEESRAPRHIIFMIGDGMGVEQISAAWICNKGALNIMRLPVNGFSRTCSADHLVTDSAAGGTALACGQRTNNKWLGLAPDRQPLTSLADLARSQGRATGLVVTKAITDATPAAFYAHVDNRDKTEAIAAALADTPFTVVTGGGAKYFTEAQMQRMQAAGTKIYLAAPKHLAPAAERADFLPEQTAAALKELEQAPGGSFLMIEGSQIDVACHDHNLRNLVAEMLEFDRTIAVVLDWMETHPDTLLVISADHQTGGLVILDGSVADGRVEAVFAAPSHNGVMVPIYAAGRGAASFSGTMDNKELSNRIRAIMSAGQRLGN